MNSIEIKFEAPIIQGDVILKKIDGLPEGAILVNGDAKVLQASEVTGHHHQFTPESKVELYLVTPESIPGVATITENQGKVIVVKEPSWLFHGKIFDHQPQLKGTGDHESIRILPGAYVVDIMREYSYEYHEVHRVVD
jgi:hypothetical protein